MTAQITRYGSNEQRGQLFTAHLENTSKPIGDDDS